MVVSGPLVGVEHWFHLDEAMIMSGRGLSAGERGLSAGEWERVSSCHYRRGRLMVNKTALGTAICDWN